MGTHLEKSETDNTGSISLFYASLRSKQDYWNMHFIAIPNLCSKAMQEIPQSQVTQ